MTKNELYKHLSAKCDALDLKIACMPDGDVNSKVAIVTNYVHEREGSLGRPLIGEIGQKFWASFMKNGLGLTRSNVYMTHGVKRFIGKNPKNKSLNIAKNEVVSWGVVLDWELALLPNLEYVIILGDMALETCLRETNIKKWRGSVIEKTLKDHRKVQCVIVDHPLTGIQQPKEEILFDYFLDKFKRVYTNTYTPHEIKYNINPTYSEAMDWMEYIHTQGNKHVPISYDLEVIGNETACMGFALDPHEGYCINFRDKDRNIFTTEEEYSLRMKMQKIFLDPECRFIAQNGNFDATWLWYKDRIKVHKNWFDTLLAHHSLYNNLPHSLGHLTAQYTNHPFYKDDSDIYKEGGDINTFWQYNIKDACITYAVQKRLHEELLQQNLDKFFFEHVMRIQPHLTEMTVNGISVLKDLKDEITESIQKQVNQLRLDLVEQAKICTRNPDYTLNPSSPVQLKRLFFVDLGLIGRGTSTDSTNRERIRKHPKTSESARKLIDLCNTYAEENKFLTTYAKTELDPDGRYRSEYKQYGVSSAPGRLSSAAPLWGTGGNAQNLPDRVNPMFYAPEGWGFGYFDLAQAEARYVAYDAQIPLWIAQFERARVDGSYDCHRALASEMYGIPYEETPAKDFDENGKRTLRYIAKRCRHGLNYRMMADTLATSAGLEMLEAIENYEIYHKKTPELAQWWKSLEVEVRKNKVLYNSYGRRWTLLEKITDDALKSMVAFRPQSSIGDKVQRVIYKCYEDKTWPTHARIIRNVHDALYSISPLNDVEQCLKLMKKYAEEPIIVRGEELIIPADCKRSFPNEQGIHTFDTMKGVKVEL